MVGLAGAGCGTVDHVDFPGDPDASADGGGVAPGADGATCTPNDRADCAGYCGKLAGRCGNIADCGACPANLTCGAAGPNLCGTGTCVPSCAGKACGASDGCGDVCGPSPCGGDGGGCVPSCSGKACGASDGCGGTCASGSCGSGQRCAGGVCVCDVTSCSGCCSGATCSPGTSPAACGLFGGACASCGTGTCTGGTCVTGPTWSACVPITESCNTACAAAGQSCVQACGTSPALMVELYSDGACTNYQEGYSEGIPSQIPLVCGFTNPAGGSTGASMKCCCQ